MKRFRFVRILVALALGSLTWWSYRALTAPTVLEREAPWPFYKAAFSADGRYVAALAVASNKDERTHLQLWDTSTGKRVAHMPPPGDPNVDVYAWACDSAGRLLAVRHRYYEMPNFAGGEVLEDVYTFFRHDPGTAREVAVQSWRSRSPKPFAEGDRFAFSYDGATLARASCHNINVKVELIDTTSGTVRRIRELPGTTGVIQLLAFPRRAGYVVITVSEGQKYPGMDKANFVLWNLDGDGNAKLKREHTGELVDFDFTPDGEHLVKTDRTKRRLEVFELKTGDKRSHDLVKLVTGTTKLLGWHPEWCFSPTFGQCFVCLMTSTNPPTSAVLDLANDTSRQVPVPAAQPWTQAWLPHSSTILQYLWAEESPNPVVKFYRHFLRWMEWDKTVWLYSDLALFDLNTGTTRSWRSFDGPMLGFSAVPSPDGCSLLLLLVAQDRKTRVELCANPALQSTVPWGIVAGFGATVLTYVVLRYLTRRVRKAGPPLPAM